MKLLELDKHYSKAAFINYLNDTLLQDFVLEERAIELDDNSIFIQMNHLGSSTTGEISIFETICDEKDSGRRITITQNAFRVLRQHGVSNALVAFTYGTKQWRLSLLTSKLEYKDGNLVSKQSNPRRYSYLLGEDAKTNTPFKQLIEKGRIDSLEDLMQRFSVEVVNKQFYDEIAKHFTELVGGERNGQNYDGLMEIYGVTRPSVKYQEFAVRLIGRIMFCWFLKEKKSTAGLPLVTEKLLSQNSVFENSDYYHAILEPLFFELLNTRPKRRRDIFKEGHYTKIPYLNGGLFSPHNGDYYKFSSAINRGAYGVVTIPDDWFRSLYGVLERFSFTVDENTAYDVELSIDPEMLGRIFENLLAEINPETGESAKKSTGSFYTPRDIVEYMVDTSLFYYLKDKTRISDEKLNAIISYSEEYDVDRPLNKSEQSEIVDALSSLTIIDPACGSGAFPIGILQKVVYILQQADPNAKLWAKKQYSSVTSAELKQEIKQKEERGLFDYIRKLGVIRESIFGVDIQTIATEIAKLRCFLSLIVEETVEDDDPNRGIQPLPNLDFKFITANSLIPLEDAVEQSGQASLFEDQSHICELKRIRDEYFTADPDERAELKVEFKDIQRAMFQTTISNYAKDASHRYKLLSEWNPFENASTTWFDPEWMFGTQKFDIVIANPPYIHLEHIKEQSAFYKTLNFNTYEARGDIYALFYEKGVQLLKTSGLLCYITSNKWMRAAYGRSLRGFFANLTNPIQLIDFTGHQIFDATVDTSILLLSRTTNQKATNAVRIKDKNCVSNMSDYIKQNSVTIPFITSDSWTILSPIEQSIKAKIDAVGIPLKNWDVKVNRGILTGCNDAFIIPEEKRNEILGNCKTAEERKRTAEIIRPILRGRDIKRYGYEWAGRYLIVAHNGYIDDNGNEIPPLDVNDYPVIKAHLDEYWDIISIRTDRGVTPYNLRNCAYMDDFSKQKIVWAETMRIHRDDISNFPRFSFCAEPMLIDKTCFIAIAEKHPLFILGFMNSSIGRYSLKRSVSILDDGGYLLQKIFLEKVILPVANENSMQAIETLVLRSLDNESLETRWKLDYLFFRLLAFSEAEIAFIEEDNAKLLARR